MHVSNTHTSTKRHLLEIRNYCNIGNNKLRLRFLKVAVNVGINWTVVGIYVLRGPFSQANYVNSLPICLVDKKGT